MAFTIHLSPTGRTFEAETHETLLEAALQQGVRLPYNCSNGTCGECRARVVSGRLERVAPHDYRLTEAEKAEGYTLLCSAYPASEMVIEARETDSAEIPHQEVTATVRRMEPLSEEVVLLHLQTPRNRTLRFLAGQYVRITLPDGQVGELAVGSCPCNGRLLQFHLSRRGGAFDRAAIEALRVGYHADIRGPYGGFTLDEASRRPLVLIASGTGFAPVKSIVEQAIALDRHEPVRLVRVADATAGHYLANYCRAWVDALDDYDFKLLGRAGHAPDDALLAKATRFIGAPQRSDVYIAASGDVRERLVALVRKGGAPPDRIAVYPHGLAS